MQKNLALELLEKYQPLDSQEIKTKEKTLQFLSQFENCFSRECHFGHFTASSWILNKNKDKALLTYHKKLHKWLQLGGHADGDSDLFAVALKEAQEESGLEGIQPLSSELFDIDVHLIPARKSDPEHYHFDFRFLFLSEDESYQVSDESFDLAWLTPDEIEQLNPEASITRMVKKWKKLIN